MGINPSIHTDEYLRKVSWCLDMFADFQIAREHAVLGVDCRRGQICAKGHAGRAALAATASLQALTATLRPAPATPT